MVIIFPILPFLMFQSLNLFLLVGAKGGLSYSILWNSQWKVSFNILEQKFSFTSMANLIFWFQQETKNSKRTIPEDVSINLAAEYHEKQKESTSFSNH